MTKTIDLLYCTTCKTEENLNKSCKDKSGKRQYYRCRKCEANRARRYRQTIRGKERVYSAVKTYNKKNPLGRKAWTKAAYLTKEPCELCGAKNVHRHHPDITKPLEVVFLCPFHHKQEHKS